MPVAVNSVVPQTVQSYRSRDGQSRQADTLPDVLLEKMRKTDKTKTLVSSLPSRNVNRCGELFSRSRLRASLTFEKAFSLLLSDTGAPFFVLDNPMRKKIWEKSMSTSWSSF